MAYGGNKRRRRNALSSIHDPKDPSPRTLPNEAREEWDEAYRNAAEVYDENYLVKRAAWREIRLRWNRTGKKTWARCQNGLCYWPDPIALPEPQADLVGLGVLVEYVYLTPQGRIRKIEIDRDHPPILWWDDDLKILYMFPHQAYPECRPIPEGMDEAVDTFERWNKREPECYDELEIPDVDIFAVGAADSLSYASDKWKDPDPDPRLRAAQEYIHDHWYDVWVWQDRERDPSVIMIEGGELDLHQKGLIH